MLSLVPLPCLCRCPSPAAASFSPRSQAWVQLARLYRGTSLLAMPCTAAMGPESCPAPVLGRSNKSSPTPPASLFQLLLFADTRYLMPCTTPYHDTMSDDVKRYTDYSVFAVSADWSNKLLWLETFLLHTLRPRTTFIPRFTCRLGLNTSGATRLLLGKDL